MREKHYVHPDGGRIVLADEDCPELDAYLKEIGASEDQELDEVDATGGAKELAEKEGVTLTEVQGTGENGRITKADVENYLESKEE